MDSLNEASGFPVQANKSVVEEAIGAFHGVTPHGSEFGASTTHEGLRVRYGVQQG